MPYREFIFSQLDLEIEILSQKEFIPEGRQKSTGVTNVVLVSIQWNNSKKSYDRNRIDPKELLGKDGIPLSWLMIAHLGRLNHWTVSQKSIGNSNVIIKGFPLTRINQSFSKNKILLKETLVLKILKSSNRTDT